MPPNIILASASQGRVNVLKNIGITPTQILPADIDETELPGELPGAVANRLAQAKAEAVAAKITDGIIIAADTVSAVGRKTLPKALDNAAVAECLRRISGRRHKVYTGLCVIWRVNNQTVKKIMRLDESIIKYKRLTAAEIAFYVDYGEGIGKGGGTTIQGISQIFIKWMSGSHSGIVGLPVHELYLMLKACGVELQNYCKL